MSARGSAVVRMAIAIGLAAPAAAQVPVGSEFLVNVATAPGQTRSPAVASDADGDFVVTWDSNQDGSATGVFARLFGSSGAPLTGELQVNTYIDSYQSAATVARSGDGRFVIAWVSRQDGSSPSGGIFAQRFDSLGAKLGSEFQVNTYTIETQTNPAAAMDADGDFVVAWQSNGQDGSQYGIFARRFASSGATQAGDFQVATYTNSNEGLVAVAMASDGAFIVVWESNSQDAGSYGIFGRRFDAAGVALAAEFQVNTYTEAQERGPAVAAEGDGDFLVAWTRAGDGEFVVVWESGNAQDGYGYGIFGQRFGALLPSLDVDGNGAVDALTDGLLVLRHRFGFTGATLTGGAVGGGCTRCDGPAVKAYLDGLGLVLDIDGNGALDALTDGLVVLRFIFGFTGSTLTSGAVGGGCTRCDAAAIQPYLASLS